MQTEITCKKIPSGKSIAFSMTLFEVEHDLL